MKLILPLILSFFFNAIIANAHPPFESDIPHEVISGYSPTELENGEIFETYYRILRPLNWNGQSRMLIAGFTEEGSYFNDFINNNELLKQGYQIVLPDTMTRKNTLERNAPLGNVGDKFEVTEKMKRLGVFQPSPEAEVEKLVSLVKNLKLKNLGILGHSRGGLLAAKLVLELKKLGHQGMKLILSNAFGAYVYKIQSFVAYDIPNNDDLRRKPEKVLEQYLLVNDWFFEGKVYTEELTKDLRERMIRQESLNSEDKAILDRNFGLVMPTYKIGSIGSIQNESAFVEWAFQHSNERHKKYDYRTGLENLPRERQWRDRERLALKSLMDELRHPVEFKNSSSLLFDSVAVLPVSIFPTLRDIKDIPIEIVVGTRDNFVENLLSELKILVAPNAKYHEVKGEGHYGPDKPESSKILAKALKSNSAFSCRNSTK